MRLIDGDALKEEVEFQQEHMWPEDLSFRIPGMIDNAPTVSAIPVEWMRNLCTIAKMETEDKIFIDWLIQMWQEEQEENRE